MRPHNIPHRWPLKCLCAVQISLFAACSVQPVTQPPAPVLTASARAPSGAGSTANGPSVSSGAASAPASRPTVPPVKLTAAETVSIEDPFGKVHRLTLRVPAGWQHVSGLAGVSYYREQTWGPKNQPSEQVATALEVQPNCLGGCGANYAQGNIERHIAEIKQESVKVIFQEHEGRRWLLIVQAADFVTGDGKPTIKSYCYVHRQGADKFAYLTGTAPTASEADIVPLMKATCATLRYEGVKS